MLPAIGVIAFLLIAVLLSQQANAETNDAGEEIQVSGSRKFDASQIASYAADAGFSGDDLITAVAIALAESNGNLDAYNPETAAGTPEGMGSYGLWQIYLKAHPEFTGWNLSDPQVNAQAAYSVYQHAGRSFRPWATFTSGIYQSRIEAATEGVNA